VVAQPFENGRRRQPFGEDRGTLDDAAAGPVRAREAVDDTTA
jgi:hypothetical protein